MKKLLDRLRRWLIRRLGGWDAILVRRTVVNGQSSHRASDLHPTIFASDIKVSGEFTGDRKKLLAWARERVTETVVHQMEESMAVVMKESYDPFSDTTTLRACVVALAGNEAREYISCRRLEE